MIFPYLSVFLVGKFPDISYSSSPGTIRCYLVKGCVLQPRTKIVGLGFVKFKSSGIKAKRPLEQIQKTHGEKKINFFGFPWGFCIDFLGNQMGDGFSQESNEGCCKKKKHD